MKQRGRHERSPGPRDGRGFWRTGRISAKPDPPEAESDDGQSAHRAEPDMIESWIPERTQHDVFDGRDVPEDKPEP